MEERIEKLEKAVLLLGELILDDARDRGTSWAQCYDSLKTLIKELKESKREAKE